MLLGTIMVLSSCQDQDHKTYEYEGKTYHFPDYVFQNPQAPEAYAIATETGEVLQYIPCYCGCGNEPFNHISVQDCFINPSKSNADQVVYSNHGAGCSTCINIVLEAKHGIQAGHSLDEIRQKIDEKYSELGVDPTPAPYPPSGNEGVS
jgi:hypothetical protein